MKTLKIKSLKALNYQRNGISGDSFYSCIVTMDDEEDTGQEYLITFEDNDDNIVIPAYTRVVSLKELWMCWRGDEFAHALNRYFKEELKNDSEKRICDLIKKEDRP